MAEPQFVTARDSRDSVWQSIVEKVAKDETQRALNRFAVAPSSPHPGFVGNLQNLVAAAHAEVFERHEEVLSKVVFF